MRAESISRSVAHICQPTPDFAPGGSPRPDAERQHEPHASTAAMCVDPSTETSVTTGRRGQRQGDASVGPPTESVGGPRIPRPRSRRDRLRERPAGPRLRREQDGRRRRRWATQNGCAPRSLIGPRVARLAGLRAAGEPCPVLARLHLAHDGRSLGRRRRSFRCTAPGNSSRRAHRRWRRCRPRWRRRGKTSPSIQ